MVRRTVNIIIGKISNFNQAAFWLACFSAASLFLALARDRILTHYFGAGLELDVYYAAFKIPDLLFVTVASLVSVSALVPIFAKKETEGEKHLKDASDSIFTVFSFGIIFFCVLCWVLMPRLVGLVFAGLPQIARAETVFLSRILLLSPLLLGFSNFFGSIVQYEKRFILYSLSPLLYNMGIIFGLLLGVGSWGIRAAVVGVCVGAFLHLALPALFVFFSSSRPRLTFSIKWRDVLETAYLSVPRTLALSISSIVGFVFASMASSMQEGSIAIFNLSFNLQSALLSLIGVSFSLAAFPSIAVSAANKNAEEVVEKISLGLKQIIFWSLPAASMLIILRAHIVRVVYGSGSFDWEATRLTAAALSIFTLSIAFQCLQLFLSRSHYALGKTAKPLFANLLGGIVSVVSALVLMNYSDSLTPVWGSLSALLDVPDLYLRVLVLSFSFSLGALVSAVSLFVSLGSQMAKAVWIQSKFTLGQSLLSSILAGLVSYITLQWSHKFFDLDYFWGVLGHGFLAGLTGIIAAVVVLKVLKSKEYLQIEKKIL